VARGCRRHRRLLVQEPRPFDCGQRKNRRLGSTEARGAVGNAGTTLHYDGGAWRYVPHGTTAPLYVVRGTGPYDVWVGGADGTMLHWDGSGFTDVPTGTTKDIWGLWARAADDAVAAVGYDFDGAISYSGSVLRWDGNAWLAQTTPSMIATLASVWGSGADDIWAVGDAGSAIHWDGAQWRQVSIVGDSRKLLGVWGRAANDVWVGGARGIAAHWDGLTWTAAQGPPMQQLRSISGDASGTWAVGDGGAVLYHP
jgi:hypothetical protein